MSVFSTDILGGGSLVVVLWDWEELSESLSNEVEVFRMVLDTTGNDEAFLWGNVFHDELLEHSGVNVSNIVGHTESWHTKGIESISGSQEHLLLLSEWVEFGQVVEEIV